ncbi:MAG: phenylacetate-CoA oxygenase/reductase subunit PaaK [Bacteroidota bacterium]|jgi:ring-1,2-phenylacetyl-CoA epoxidase subunit PaaE
MPAHFYSLAVKDIKQETADCVSIQFAVPESLVSTFVFAPGQNIAIKKNVNNQEVRRTYSICSAPYEKELRIAVKKVADGLFSNYANKELKVGDTLAVMAPAGRFCTPINPFHSKKYVAIVAGSGITPVLSVLKTILKEEPNSQFVLVYGNQTRQSIIFFEALESLKNKYLHRFSIINILSREKTDTPLHHGRIDAEKLQALYPIINYAEVDEFFICGPQQMIGSVNDFLINSGVPQQQIHIELFAATLPPKKITATAHTPNDKVSQLTVIADGSSKEWIIPLNGGLTILDAALQNGADLPYACKGGMCCTCKAKLIEGNVQMDVHWGLEADEVSNGYILTCQAYPTTEKVVVDFDCK